MPSRTCGCGRSRHRLRFDVRRLLSRLIGLRLRLGLRPRRLARPAGSCLRGRRLRRRRRARAVFEQPRNQLETADHDHDDGGSNRDGPEPLREFFRLLGSGTADPGDLAIARRGGGGLRRAARGGDEIRLATGRVGNDGGLRSDHGFRCGNAVGRGCRLARAARKRAGLQRMIRRQARVDRRARRARRRLRDFDLAQLRRHVGGDGGCDRHRGHFRRRGNGLEDRGRW